MFYPTMTTISGVQISGGRVDTLEGGDYVVRVPSVGYEVRVPLRPIARRLQIRGVEIGAEAMRAIDDISRPAIGAVSVDGVEIGAFLKRLAKKVKKAVKKTVKVAKKVANNKLVKGLYKAAKAIAPPPINTAIAATEAGVKVAKAIAKGSKKAKKVLSVAKQVAKGKLSPAQVNAAAKKLKAKPDSIKGAAFMIQAAKAPPGSPAKKVLDQARAIENTAAQQTQRPPTKARSGKEYTIPIKGKRYVMVLKAVA